MDNFFTDPADLTNAIVAKVKNPGGVAVVVPTIKEQLTKLIQPGHVVAFRTESGSYYEINMYSSGESVLVKVDEETDGIREVAKGELIGAHDRGRGVYGIRIEEPNGRTYTTSAVVKVWMSYDATIGDTGKSYNEPA